LKSYFIADASFLIILDEIKALYIIKKMMEKGYFFVISLYVMKEVNNIDNIYEMINNNHLI